MNPDNIITSPLETQQIKQTKVEKLMMLLACVARHQTNES